MNYEEKKSKGVETNMFLKNSKTREILELCIQPKSENDMEDILLKFHDKCKELAFCSVAKCPWELDVMCMCILNYLYENYTVSVSAVSRSPYFYEKLIQIPWSEDNCFSHIKSISDYDLKELHQITNLYTYSNCEDILINITLGSIFSGNLGIASFLVKFGFVEFPAEINEKGKKMTKILVNSFNESFHHPIRNVLAGEMRTFIELEKLLNLMRHSENKFRRSLLTFCAIILISEYTLYKNSEIDSELYSFNANMKSICHRKFMCLNLLIKTTTETNVTLKDIENFIAEFINPLLNADVGRSLLQASREILFRFYEYYNPRSLKDLTRCKIRENLQNSMTFSEQINQLDVPISLKEFLLFNIKEIWVLFKYSLLSNVNVNQLQLRAELTRMIRVFENYV